MPTPEQQVASLRATMQRMRENYEAQLTNLREARDAANLRANEALALKGSLQRAIAGRADIAGLQEQRIVALQDENERLRAALAASTSLRVDMVRPLVVWVAAEDNEALGEDEYSRRVDAALREARTILSRNALVSAATDSLLGEDV